ncbi:ABC-2 type transport system ATP-binding protein [Parafrankia irregularis]|uniref:ABC-2 type transport system ATP-binding protein n=1 Tax=Parafrankia irregularis TaxID=795642 RepID=A0A0S4QI73_9ACTN|nr:MULTISPECIES: ATP-binding cassette domain-containing protein [Parafrankia]MBE3203940.1 ATP-binding cassette domain-containing protein [Parafrankia sp. CH37]CUU55187.1 ABC-2 type transport system ATP-binding protein [Parafrankia irregularis]
MTPVVRFDAFTKAFGETVAVKDLSFEVAAGRVVGLVGPNGAGKSTSLRGLLGLVRPTSGSATVFGGPYSALTDPARRVGVSMDGVGINPAHSGRRHLTVYARAIGLPDSRVDEVLELTGVADAANRRLRGWSTGMRQRLGLATALLGDPDLLVLDEPTNGLDPEGVRWLRTFLRDQAAAGRTVLLSSHMLAELENTVDDIAIINRGVLFVGELSSLVSDGARLEERFFDLLTKPALAGVGASGEGSNAQTDPQ